MGEAGEDPRARVVDEHVGHARLAPHLLDGGEQRSRLRQIQWHCVPAFPLGGFCGRAAGAPDLKALVAQHPRKRQPQARAGARDQGRAVAPLCGKPFHMAASVRKILLLARLASGLMSAPDAHPDRAAGSADARILPLPGRHRRICRGNRARGHRRGLGRDSVGAGCRNCARKNGLSPYNRYPCAARSAGAAA